MAKQKIIFFVVEKGYLEEEVIMLVNSLRSLAKLDASYRLIAINPGKAKISEKTFKKLNDLSVTYHHEHLNREYSFYPLANKVFSASFIETTYAGQYNSLIFLDSDIIALKALPELTRDFKIGAKPVDIQSVGINPGEPPNMFWKLVYDACGLSMDHVWTMKTSVDLIPINTFFNSGVIIKKADDFFRSWEDNFIRCIQDKRSFELSYEQYYFLEQAIFSSSVNAYYSKTDVLLLSNNENYPLPRHETIAHPVKSLSEISILHYHDFIREERYLPLIEDIQPWIEKFEHKKPKSAHWIKRMGAIYQFQIHKLRYKYDIL